MRFKIMILGLVIASSSLYAKSVYKTQDSFGRTIYSDKPQQGAEKIEIPEMQTYTAPQVSEGIPIKEEAPPSITEYKIAFIQPEQDQVYTHEIENISIKISVTPALAKEHAIQLMLNGKPYGALSNNTAFSVPHLDRGAHSLQAVIIDSNTKKALSQTEVVTIHQRRNVVTHP